MRQGLGVLVCAAVAALGCGTAGAAATPCGATSTPGGEWRSYAHDAANTRTQDQESGITPLTAAALKPAWTFRTGASDAAGGFNSTPIVAAGCVFVTSAGGVVYALDQATGAVRWQT